MGEKGQRYSIQVTDATKDGEILKFTVQTKLRALDNGIPENGSPLFNENSESESGKIVLRQYEDFEYLLHTLTSKNDCNAVFVPSLPPRPFIAPNQTDAKNKISNSVSQLVKGDEYVNDCKRIQKFIQDIAAHPIFINDDNLKTFLTEEQAPARAQVKRGLLDSFITVVDNARFHHFPDTDEEFQSWRDNTNNLLSHLKQLHMIKERLLMVENGHSASLGSLSKTFSNLNLMELQHSKLLMRFTGQFADTLDDIMKHSQRSTAIFEDGFGAAVELYARYMQSCQVMLFRRTTKLAELDSANKALAKAKPKNQEQLQTAKDDAEKAFNEITEIMKTEFETFTANRIKFFKDSLEQVAVQKVDEHKKTCEALSKVIVELKAAV